MARRRSAGTTEVVPGGEVGRTRPVVVLPVACRQYVLMAAIATAFAFLANGALLLQDARIAALRAGRPFVVQGWQVDLKPSYASFVVESDGTAAEVEVVRHARPGGGVLLDYRRADGTVALPW
jgi:hypothetical protein